jgi:hypothetical protein
MHKNLGSVPSTNKESKEGGREGGRKDSQLSGKDHLYTGMLVILPISIQIKKLVLNIFK